MAFSQKYTELGMTKPVEVKVTNKVLKDTIRLQKEIIEKNEIIASPETGVNETMTALYELMEFKFNYIVKILHLTEKQAEKLDSLEPDETEEIIGKIVSQVFGIEDSEDEESEGKE